MKNMKRALRRHHVARLKKARSYYWGRDIRQDVKSLGKAIDTPTPCSCWLCGNPRRTSNEVTLQERCVSELDKTVARHQDLKG